jgi:hypothetical protein
MTKIKTGSGLASYLDSVIQETVKSSLQQRALKEREKQDLTQGSKKSNNSSGNNQSKVDEDNSGDTVASKTMDDETDKLKTGESIKADDIVSRLNTIRGGHSFKDEHVAAAMEEYVESLTNAEKTALLAFLKGISQIVTGEISGDDATDPKTHPADVKMKKDNETHQQKKHVDPNVIKTTQDKKPKKDNKEDTSGPVPITPKK